MSKRKIKHNKAREEQFNWVKSVFGSPFEAHGSLQNKHQN